jgi:hypothetical protein
MFLSFKEFKNIAEIGDPEVLVYPYNMVPEYPRDEISTVFSLGSHDGPAAGLITMDGKFYLAESLEFNSFPRIFLILDLEASHVDLFLNYCFWYSKFKSDGICFNYNGLSGPCAVPLDSLTIPQEELTHPSLKVDIGSCKVIGYFKSWRLLY